MTEVSAFLGAQPRAGPPRDVSTSRGGVSTTFQSCQSLAMGATSAWVRLSSGECRFMASHTGQACGFGKAAKALSPGFHWTRASRRVPQGEGRGEGLTQPVNVKEARALPATTSNVEAGTLANIGSGLISPRRSTVTV